MAYEILNQAPVTPARLHALLHLVGELDAPTRGRLAGLLQPNSVNENQSAFGTVYEAATKCELLRETEGGTVRLTVSPSAIESPERFRTCMASILLGVTEEQRPNYLFNMYTAWYVAQDADVLRMSDVDLYGRFNEQMYPDADERKFNDTKFRGWRQWAQFLGLGWRVRDESVLMPDATGRIEGVLGEMVSGGGRMPIGEFLQQLGACCPELDGGQLYATAWGASHAEERGHTVSLAVSTGLRVLDRERKVRLIREADAGDMWGLFGAEGAFFQGPVTHIGRGERFDG